MFLYILDCGYVCENDDVNDYFAVDPNRCDILHRCFNKQVYTSFCAPGTFFSPNKCACTHTEESTWCRQDGAVLERSETNLTICRIT